VVTLETVQLTQHQPLTISRIVQYKLYLLLQSSTLIACALDDLPTKEKRFVASRLPGAYPNSRTGAFAALLPPLKRLPVTD
jgi:hypothetical protein